MNYYIINTSKDYADEFGYPVVSIMNEHVRDFLINTYETWNQHSYSECYFGTNEALEYEADEILDYITTAEKIDEAKLKLIQPYLTTVGQDIARHVMEMMYYNKDFPKEVLDKANTIPYKDIVKLHPELFV